MKKIICLILVFISCAMFAQEYKVLDKELYKINMDAESETYENNVLTPIAVLKKDKKTNTFKKVKLKKGKYQLQSTKDAATLYKIKVGRKGLLQDIIYFQEKKMGGWFKVKNSLISSFSTDIDENTQGKGTVNRRDSILLYEEVYKKDKDTLRTEAKIFLTKENFKKAVVRYYNSNKEGYYEVNGITGEDKVVKEEEGNSSGNK